MISERALRAILAVIASITSSPGCCPGRPDTFFDQIGHYGIENSHYVGDVGAFCSLSRRGRDRRRPSPWRAPLLCLGALWYGFHASTTLSTPRSQERGARLERHAADRLRGVASAWLARVSDGCSGAAERGDMKVFVAGASGAIGKPLMRQLAEAGHEVTGRRRREGARPGDPGRRGHGRRLRRLRPARFLERRSRSRAGGGSQPGRQSKTSQTTAVPPAAGSPRRAPCAPRRPRQLSR